MTDVSLIRTRLTEASYPPPRDALDALDRLIAERDAALTDATQLRLDLETETARVLSLEAEKNDALRHMRERANAAELRAAGLEAGDGWLPIESAPRNGTPVQLWRAGEYDAGHFDDDQYAKKPRPYWFSKYRNFMGTLWMRKNPPTHWRPLPAPPGDAT